MDATKSNTGIWASTLASASAKEFKDIAINEDLFAKMTMPACFSQCSRTDIDIVFKEELECMYKCQITYKQSLKMLQETD